MPQISRKPLDKRLEEEILKQFWHAISKANNSSSASEFLSDLLTETEKIMLAKRFAVALLIAKGWAYSDIKRTLHVTQSTVGSVNNWVGKANPETVKIFKSIVRGQQIQSFLDTIEELIDFGKPGYRANWKKEAREKYDRNKRRFARERIR